MRNFYGVTLSWTVTDHVCELRLHRAPCNEIGSATLRELEELVAFIQGGAAGARAMVIWSDRDAGFCAGADLRELYEGIQTLSGAGIRQMLPEVVRGGSGRLKTLADLASTAFRRGSRAVTHPLVRREIRKHLLRIHAVMDALDMAPLTTVAAVHGFCFGGGLELALTADVIVADRSARFALPELRLGLVPGFGGIPRLERNVGNAVARDILLTGRSLGARRAHEVGLVQQVVGRGKALDAARSTARQAARFDAEVIAKAKAFTKKLPRARLDEEIATFMDMASSPRLEAALERFVTSTDVRPYL